MVGKIKQVIKLWVLHAKMDLAWLLRDFVFAVLAIFSDFISCIASVISIFLLAIRFDGIGDMTRYEVFFMLAYFTIVTGLMQMLMCGGNMGHISRVIGRGQLEHMLIQPVPLPVQIITSGIIPFTGGSAFYSGVAMLIIATINLGISITWWWVFAIIASVIISFAIYLGFMYLFSTFAFYAPVGAEEITTSVEEVVGVGMYPLSGMPAFLQIPLITVVPTGLLGWFPTLALLGKSPLDLNLWYPLIFVILLWIITTYLFRKGMKHYVKKGINRYTNIGFR